MTDVGRETYRIRYNKNTGKIEYKKEQWHVAYGEWTEWKIIVKDKNEL